MALEVLRAKLRAAGNLREELASSAVTASATADAIDDLGDEAASSSAQAAVFAEGIDKTAQESAAASAQAALLEQRIESLGDEATQSAVKAQALDKSLDGIDADGLGANIAGLSGSVGQLAAVAAAATPVILGFGSALGGLAVGGGGLAAGAIGLTAAGIQSRAESMAAFSDELETAADAREQLLGNFKSRLADAFEPLQNAQTEQFALNNLSAVVSIAENAATSLRSLQGTLINVAGAFRETIVATSGDLFGAVAEQTDRLSPLLLQLRGAISDLPALIAFLGDAAVRIGPQLFNLGAALVPVVAGITEFGIAAADILLPALNPIIFLLGTLGSIFSALPGPLQNAAVFFTIATAAIAAEATAAGIATAATGALVSILGTIAGVLTSPITLLAALGAAAIAVASHFGLLDAVFSVIVATWNGLVELVEFSINAFISFAQTVADVAGPFLFLLGPIGALLFLIGNFNEIMNATTDVIDGVVSKIKELGRIAGRVLSPVLDAINAVTSAVDEQGGVSLDAAKAGGGSNGDSGDGPQQPQQPSRPTGPPRAGGSSRPPQRSQQATAGGQQQTFDFSGADFSGSDPTRTKEQIKQAVKEANQSARNTERGSVQ